MKQDQLRERIYLLNSIAANPFIRGPLVVSFVSVISGYINPIHERNTTMLTPLKASTATKKELQQAISDLCSEESFNFARAKKLYAIFQERFDMKTIPSMEEAIQAVLEEKESKAKSKRKAKIKAAIEAQDFKLARRLYKSFVKKFFVEVPKFKKAIEAMEPAKETKEIKETKETKEKKKGKEKPCPISGHEGEESPYHRLAKKAKEKYLATLNKAEILAKKMVAILVRQLEKKQEERNKINLTLNQEINTLKEKLESVKKVFGVN